MVKFHSDSKERLANLNLYQPESAESNAEETLNGAKMNNSTATLWQQDANSKRDGKFAITPTRQENFPAWYQEVIKAANLAENSVVRGCMVIKPNGMAIWDRIRTVFDKMLKEVGVQNAYFPVFIPLSYFQKEAEHAEGFATEVAVVTHRRLEKDSEGILQPAAKLEEPLIVRPTSEMIIGQSMSDWIQSHRDLPLKLNQWCNVVRMEMRPRLFLRTTEFLWHEGHSAHASAEEAFESTKLMHQVYERFIRHTLAIPLVPGEKIPQERFAGADRTLTLEAMMQDRKALQAATSHYLGQNFAKAMNIKFQNQRGETEYAYTTSWGMSTRMIGALIMAHSDDDGLRLPPRITPTHIIILPIIPREEVRLETLEYAEKISSMLKNLTYNGEPLSVEIDARDIRGGQKSWEAVKRGIPLRVEVGPKEAASGNVVVMRRDYAPNNKALMQLENLPAVALAVLDEIHANYYNQAEQHMSANIHMDITDMEELKRFFTPKNEKNPEIHGGWVRGKWSEDPETLDILKDMKLTIRCIPFDQTDTEGKCVVTGKPATLDVIYGKAY